VDPVALGLGQRVRPGLSLHAGLEGWWAPIIAAAMISARIEEGDGGGPQL
jgi:hypothetical protein